MTKKSAGILLYRFRDGILFVLLVHPGGPYWTSKDLGAWSIPKGLIGADEDPLEAALREFREETGFSPGGTFISLPPVKLKSGKVIEAWGVEGNIDASSVRSNTFLMEWPPGSGTQREFPEIDRAGWFEMEEARRKISQGQVSLLDTLQQRLSRAGSIGSQEHAP